MCVIVVVGVGQRIMSERRALGLNEKEWTIEFDHAPRMREIRHHPWASVPKEDNLAQMEKVYLFKWQPSHHRTIVLQIYSFDEKLTPVMTPPSARLQHPG